MIQKFLNWWKYGDGDIPGGVSLFLYTFFLLSFGLMILGITAIIHHVRFI